MIKINEKLIKEKIEAAFKSTCRQFREPLRDAIVDEVWDWPRLTQRHNGDIVGTPRDIVDLGTLRDSQILIFNSPTNAQYQYPLSYALAVHEGYTTRKGTNIPARPWTEKAVKDFNIAQSFAHNLLIELTVR